MTKTGFVFLSLLMISPVSAEIISQHVQDGCKNDNFVLNGTHTKLYAKWQPNLYTCAVGYYLPAGAVSCQLCPETHMCPGGTYVFNANHSQGVENVDILVTDAIGSCSPKFTQNFSALFKPITYNCDSGYYLPADGIECVVCPNNNYCPGGKYGDSETVAQGIMECPNNMFSPVGVFEVGACGRKLHIGDETLYIRSQKKTTPSLNFDINHDGIPDFFGNATLQRTTINSSSQRYLHVGEYYIYDDSIRLEE